jgi:hypothetical protein
MKFVHAGIREVSMRRISRTVFGVLASASLLGGIGGAALAVMTSAATSAQAGVVAAVRVPNPTAVEYGATMVEY